MGKASAFVKERLNEIHRRKVARSKKSLRLKHQRRGDDNSARLVQRVQVSKALPAVEDAKLLFDQFLQACRLPNPAHDICRILESPHTPVDSIISVATTIQQTDAATIDEIVRDECGAKVIGALVMALHRGGDANAKVMKAIASAILGRFEADTALLRHHVGARLLSIIACNSSEASCAQILAILRSECATEDDAMDLIKDRHAAATLIRLLTVHQSETSKWLSQLLKLTSSPAADAPAKKKSKKDPEAVGNELTSERIQQIRSLVEDPVASPVVHAVVSDDNRLTLFKALSFGSILEAKRLSRFFNAILDVTAASSPLATQLLDVILFDETNASVLMDAVFDSVCNFTAQKVFALLNKADDRVAEFHRRLVDLMSPKLAEMARHNIATHVVVAFVDASAKIADSGKSVKSVVEILCRPETVFDLIRDRHTSLVVRKIVEHCAALSNKSGGVALLFATIEQHFSSLMYDSMGNLIVQQVIKSSGPQGASVLFRKFLRGEELVSAAQHQSASHVVFTLMECVDPQTLSDLCGALKPHVVTLAKHINGRFIVEKMIPLQRDIRETLLRQFVPLALAKGTQHLLVLLYSSVDNQTRQNLTQNILIPQLRSLATNPISSIVVQKLLQASPPFVAAAKKWAASGTALRDLSQDFYGKFVAQIITNSA